MVVFFTPLSAIKWWQLTSHALNYKPSLLFSVLLVTYNWFKIQHHLPSVGVNVTSELQSGRTLCQLLLTIRYTWVDPLVRLIFSITYSKEKVCLPNGNVVDLCLRYLPLYYSTSRKKVEHLGNFLHISTSKLCLTVWHKFISSGFQKEGITSWKLFVHIAVTHRLLVWKVSYMNGSLWIP